MATTNVSKLLHRWWAHARATSVHARERTLYQELSDSVCKPWSTSVYRDEPTGERIGPTNLPMNYAKWRDQTVRGLARRTR